MSNQKKIEKIRMLIDDLKKTLTSSDFREVSQVLARQIRIRTRLGYGVESGKQSKLKPLDTERYVPLRQKNKSNLSSETTAKKSNLTATGQMLDSIKQDSNGRNIAVSVSGKRTKELTERRSVNTNSDIARYAKENGRNFFEATNAEKQLVAREIKKRMLRGLK